MSSFQLFGVNYSGSLFSLSTDQSSWEEVPDVRIKFKKFASHESIIWALGEDHQVYVYVYGTSAPIRVCEESYENQRWYPIEGFTSKLLPTDRTNFSSEDGLSDKTLTSIDLPTEAWIWEGPWHVDNMFEGKVLDDEAWTYSLDFPWSYTADTRWNSHVRRRKWVRYRRYAAFDSWTAVTPSHQDHTKESFLDISIGGTEVPGVDADELMVWAVTALNRESQDEEFEGVPQSQQTKVYVREGVCGICPEGVSWTFVPTPADQDVISLSVGRSGRVWAVTWDGTILARTGISKNTLTGTDWKIIESPPDGILQHIAVGVNAVWALTRDNKVWFRGECARDQEPSCNSVISQQEQPEDFVYVNNDLDKPWQLVEGNLSMISVGHNDQVWGVTAEEHMPVMGTGKTLQEMTGSTWQPIAIPLISDILTEPVISTLSPQIQTHGEVESSEDQIIDTLTKSESCNSPDAFKDSSLRLIQESDEENLKAVSSDSEEINLKSNHQIDQLKSCSICYEGYNDDEHRPLVLPCGHTLCKECINKISSGYNISVIQCPICRTNHSINRNNLPTNYVVLDLIRATGSVTQIKENVTHMSSEFRKDDPNSEEDNGEEEETISNPANSGGMSKTTKNILIGTGVGLGAVATGVGAVLAAPVVLTGLGFTSAGIAAGSVAASMMSAAAVAEGGGIAAGSLVAVLQSAGAAGLSAGAAAGVGAAGATVGAAAGTGIALGLKGTSQDETVSTDDTQSNSQLKMERIFKKLAVKPSGSYYFLKVPINWS